MTLSRFSVHNYKSVRQVALEVPGFSVLVGPNASGKSNFVDALHFVSEVYKHGLEVAVARKGGYENICFRRERRSKAPIRFELSVQINAAEFGIPGRIHSTHSFAFQAKGEGIRADFAITKESLCLQYEASDSHPGKRIQQLKLFEGDTLGLVPLLEVIRGKKTEITPPKSADGLPTRLKAFVDRLNNWGPIFEVDETELAATFMARLFPPFQRVVRNISNLRVYQLSPRMCRESGVPVPSPELDRFGNNLPAMVDFLQRRHPIIYKKVLESLQVVLPSLQEVEVKYTQRRTLGLSFKEIGVGRPWTTEDVSDGTVQTLAMLVALFDPRNRVVVIEEPENSIHPWILRNIVEACKEAAKEKQVVLTTHSPVVVNMLDPKDLFIVSKVEGATHVQPCTALDASLETLWSGGDVLLADYVDSGAIPAAVPLSGPIPKAKGE